MKFKFHRPDSIGYVAQLCIWGGLLVFVGGLYVALARFLRLPELAEKAQDLYEKNAEAFLAGYSPFYVEYMQVFPLVVAAVGFLLFIAGTGMLKMRRWSRRLAVLVCFLMIVVFLGELVYQYAVVLPGLDAWFSEYRSGAALIEAEAPRIGYVMDAGIWASLLPFVMIGLALGLWHLLRSPMLANTLVFGRTPRDKARPEREPRAAPVAEALPPVPAKRSRKGHRSRKER
ncbi:MAG: hypothetical protein AB7K24_20125 [Gemmataceae bacterium]